MPLHSLDNNNINWKVACKQLPEIWAIVNLLGICNLSELMCFNYEHQVIVRWINVNVSVWSRTFSFSNKRLLLKVNLNTLLRFTFSWGLIENQNFIGILAKNTSWLSQICINILLWLKLTTRFCTYTYWECQWIPAVFLKADAAIIY